MDRSFLAARRVIVRAAAEHEPDGQDPMVEKNHQTDRAQPAPTERLLMFATERQGKSTQHLHEAPMRDDWAHIEF